MRETNRRYAQIVDGHETAFRLQPFHLQLQRFCFSTPEAQGTEGGIVRFSLVFEGESFIGKILIGPADVRFGSCERERKRPCSVRNRINGGGV
jgi:hypothetical protein